MGVPRRWTLRARDLLRAHGVEVVRIDWDASLHGLQVSRLLSRFDITTVLDVGARQGEFGSWLRDQGYTGRIVSFEPVPSNLVALDRAARADGSWAVHPYALGATEETRTMNVTTWTHFSSFREARTDVVTSGLDKRSVETTVDVPVRRLEEVWPDVVGPGPGGVFLKCDTQGWDLEVLTGAGHRLGDVAVLQTEVSNLPIYQGMPDMLESLAAVRAHGFTISGLFPLNGGPDLAPIEFDCLAVRRVAA